MPESKLHLALRTFLFQLLQFTFGESCSVGSEQFVYWRASDPTTCLAPDAFLKRGTKDSRFDSWKTWERGTPELAVEIVSESDRRGWDEKLAEYRDLAAWVSASARRGVRHRIKTTPGDTHPGTPSPPARADERLLRCELEELGAHERRDGRPSAAI